MARRGVIQDSDDEGGDFSPLKSDHASPIYSAEVATEADATATNVARSTDSDFFQDVYQEQQDRALENLANHASTGDTVAFDSVDDFLNRVGPSADLIRMDNNSSSITDPTVASRRKKTTSAKDLESITQVTTPGKKPSAPLDPYAIPSSPPEPWDPEHGNSTKAKNPRTYGKRKRTPKTTPAKLDLEHVPDQHASEMYSRHDLSPLPTKRRRTSQKGRGPEHLADDVDLVTIPRTADAIAPAAARLRDETSSSIVYDTMKTVSGTTTDQSAPSFYITQGQLSASQKLQYQQVSCSSEQGFEGNEGTLSTKLLTSQVEQRSSSDATIAYTTPSRFGSSNAPRPSAAQQSGALVSSASVTSSAKKRKDTEPGYEPASSPDILTGYPPNQRRAKQDQDCSLQETITQGSSVPSATKKRKKQQSPSAEALWGPEDEDLPQEQYIPRPSKRRSMAASLPDTLPPDEPDEVHQAVQKGGDPMQSTTHSGIGYENQPILVSSGQADITEQIPEPPQPKKRGRKKKLKQNDSDGTASHQQQPLDSSGPGPQPVVTETTAPAKKKRGRPKKAESQPPPGIQDDGVGGEIKERAEDTVEEAVENGDTSVDRSDICNVDEQLPPNHDPESPPVTEAKRRGRGRKKMAETKSTPEKSGRTASPEKDVLKDISNVAMAPEVIPSADESGEKAVKVTKEPQVVKKEIPTQDSKTAVSNSQTGKVAYRVGLSKRSRIAPLLKSLRK